MSADEADQSVSGRKIGTDGMFGSTAVPPKMFGPQHREAPGRMIIEGQGSSHRPIMRESIAPRKPSSSEPARVSKPCGRR